MANKLFNQLWEWSHQEDSFSIRDFADSVGMTYKAIHDLSKENEEWTYVLGVSKAMLTCNAEKAIITGIITIDCYTSYIYENDYLVREDIQEREGIIIPEDPDEFDDWVKDLIKKEEEEERKFKQRRETKRNIS